MNKNTVPNIGIFSFFSGAGFLDLGFEKTRGYEILLVNELHGPFLEIYKSSRTALQLKPPKFGYSCENITSYLGERSEVLKEQVELARNNCDLIGFIGGPPCPDFSVGGKNKGIKGENGKLSRVYFELIVKNKPDFFLFENVKGLYRTVRHREFFDEMKRHLASNGYCLSEKLINTIEFGVPQDRERIILVGFQKSRLHNFGLELTGSTELPGFDWKSKTKFTTEKVFSKAWPSQDIFEQNSVRPVPSSIYKNLTVEHWFKKNDVENHPNSNHYFQPRAGLTKFLTIQEGDDLKKSYKRLHRWRYSPTAAYGNNEVHLHPYKARRISAAEALAIQSLPKDFFIPGNITLSNMFKTIGNGVPYLAAKGLAETILDFVHKNIKQSPKNEKVNCQ